MRYLKQNTATVITIGPFLDKTDGITAEVALTVTSCHLTLMVDNAGTPTLALDANATASAGSNDMVHITNDDAGFYSLELTAANTNYLGGAILSINDVATHCPVFHEFTILSANIYDSMVAGSDLFDVSVVQVAGSTTNVSALATNADAIKTKTDFLPSATAGAAGGVFIAGSNAATSITTALTANITGNLSGSVGSVTGAVGSVTGAVGSVTGAVGSVTSGVTVTTNNDKTGYTASTVSDKTGYSLTQAFPTNFADLAITVTTGRVTAGTVSDKTGYSLTQTFPTNFASMSITAGGLMDINLAQTISAQTGAPTTVGGSLYFNRQAIKNKLNYAKSTDTMILYEDDGTTPKFTFTMVDDASSATRGAGA